jgi:uncharacterized protein YndB with AHSA1/START domain
MESKKLTVQVTVDSNIENAWKCWTSEYDILKWNQASDDWHTTKVINNLKVGGEFSYRMEAKDGSFGFDFGGVYDEVSSLELIKYTLGDGRKVNIQFSSNGSETIIVQEFEAEKMNPAELQQNGWQAIMNNFKKYVESIKS